MKIFLTGATGFIGRALVLRLLRDGHEITALVRDKTRAQSLLGQQCSFLESGTGQLALKTALAESDAVINLAGEPLLGRRWNEKRLESIRKSRLDVTRQLVEAMTPGRTPKVFISTSAVGIYGNGGEKVLTEESESGTDFLATLCRDWETEAIKARDLGVRVVRLRIGVVLGRGGGALDQMLTPFKVGVGGPIGTGKQFVPWIHIEDLVELIVTGLDNSEMSGAFNATAPNPVTFSDFAKALGKQLKRPSFVPVPEFAVKLLFGDASIVLLQGQRAIPAHAQKIGFVFKHQTIESALKDLLDK
ncbi:MAG: TIGR01777 family oxidoreductase [Bacteroidetes bacterium]|nr:TIGR01777 family oxidoreductase [Bacteroidota bacterium]